MARRGGPGQNGDDADGRKRPDDLSGIRVGESGSPGRWRPGRPFPRSGLAAAVMRGRHPAVSASSVPSPFRPARHAGPRWSQLIADSCSRTLCGWVLAGLGAGRPGSQHPAASSSEQPPASASCYQVPAGFQLPASAGHVALKMPQVAGMPNDTYDVAIIGGGPAGLTAGLWLGRYLHRVVVIDSGDPRNWETRAINGFPGHPGITPAELRGITRDECRDFDVSLVDGFVSRARVNGRNGRSGRNDGNGRNGRKSGRFIVEFDPMPATKA